ncbi:MAG TPA: hypothetical protein VFQ19_11395 [Nocardioidaceae bacterium]|nr:hypothetical protein [Nocardioidaceae bacterium]
MGHKPTDSEKNEPSLELPSLSLPRLGRRRSRQNGDSDTPVQEPTPEPPAHRVADDGTGGFSLPAVPARVAAVVTGVVVGLFGVAATSLALAGCEAMTGTSSCGGPGFFLLVAILAVMVLLGTALLKAWKVADAGSTSFLAVGVLTVVVLLVLLDLVFSAWMFLVVPLLTGAAYALAHWVTTRFGDEAPGPPER